ncbi:MAG: hypothetical protein WBA00_00670 [Rhodococcus sp. (in: high G+C Gram-positive bacteria)]
MSLTATGLLRSEIRKVASLRTWWALGLPPVLIGGFASAIYAGIAASEVLSGAPDIDRFAALIGLYVTVGTAVVFAALFGAVQAATEVRHGTATSTFLTAPRRGHVVAAKILVSAAVGTGYGVVSVAVSLASIAAFGDGAVAIGDGLVIAVALLGIVSATLWSVLGCGLGLLMGSPTWAAVAIVAWLPVGELVVIAILTGVGADAVAALLPGALTAGVLAADRAGDSGVVMPFPVAVVGLLLWTVGFAAVGWWRSIRRDLT